MNKEDIPYGMYCYSGDYTCPYWSKRADKRERDDGYCSYLDLGDWMENGTFLLWDQVKECGVNEEEIEYWECPHCGHEESWFDRSLYTEYNEKLNEYYEIGPFTRCTKCGRSDEDVE